MGCVATSSFGFNEYCKTVEYSEWEKTLRATQLSRSDIRQIYNIFLRLDLEKKGQIRHTDVSNYFGLERTPFTDRALCVLSEDEFGDLSFVQFLLTVHSLCTLTQDELVSFVFDLCDIERSGMVPRSRLVDMLQDLYRCEVAQTLISTMATNDFKSVVHTKQSVTLEMFHTFVSAHPGLLQPVHQLQHTLRLKTLGIGNWKIITRKRARKRGTFELEDTKQRFRTDSSQKKNTDSHTPVHPEGTRVRRVRSVRVTSCEERESADASETLTSFFLLETPLPQPRGSSWKCDLREDFSLIDQA